METIKSFKKDAKLWVYINDLHYNKLKKLKQMKRKILKKVLNMLKCVLKFHCT